MTTKEVEMEKDRKDSDGDGIWDTIIKVDQKYPIAENTIKYFSDWGSGSIAMINFSHTWTAEVVDRDSWVMIPGCA